MSKDITETTWPDATQAGAQPSVLSEDVQIDGEVRSTGPIELSGKITGQLTAPEVTIKANGSVNGRVNALNLTVQGGVEGTIMAKAVTLAKTAVVQAEITHELITIETGARLEGSLRRRG